MSIGRTDRESPGYAALRDELQQAEIDLRDQRERVAALRRSLPLDQAIEDHLLQELRDGRAHGVRLSELFDDPSKPLILMHFMFGKAQTSPCPMCTMWADGYDAVIPHLRQSVNFAVLAAGDAGAFEAYGRERGWRSLRLLSAGDSRIKRDLGFETDEGGQHPGVSVFARDEEGGLVHFYSQSADLGEAGFRGMDLLTQVWSFLDLTPQGRGEWFPSKTYAS